MRLVLSHRNLDIVHPRGHRIVKAAKLMRQVKINLCVILGLIRLQPLKLTCLCQMLRQLSPTHDVSGVMPPRLFSKSVIEVFIQILSICLPRLRIRIKIVLIDLWNFKALTKDG